MFLPRALSATTDAKNAIVRCVHPFWSALFEIYVFHQRISSLTDVFHAPLLSEAPFQVDGSQKLALEVRDATFEWEESLAVKEAKEAQAEAKGKKGKASVAAVGPKQVDDAPPFQVRNITMLVPRGSLVAVVGAVGSGKVC